MAHVHVTGIDRQFMRPAGPFAAHSALYGAVFMHPRRTPSFAPPSLLLPLLPAPCVSRGLRLKTTPGCAFGFPARSHNVAARIIGLCECVHARLLCVCSRLCVCLCVCIGVCMCVCAPVPGLSQTAHQLDAHSGNGTWQCYIYLTPQELHQQALNRIELTISFRILPFKIRSLREI